MRRMLSAILVASLPMAFAACSDDDGGKNQNNNNNNTTELCGNGAVDEGEDCDSNDLDGNDCTTISGGFTGGTLGCNNETCEFVTSQCTTDATEFCGDGTVDEGEDCDSDDLNGNDCTTIAGGFTGGTLGCNNATCEFDASERVGQMIGILGLVQNQHQQKPWLRS